MDPITSNDPSLAPFLTKLKNPALCTRLSPSYGSDCHLRDLVLDDKGIVSTNITSHESLALRICSRCYSQLRNPSVIVPKFALANNLFSLAYVVKSLPTLNFTEEKIIARVRLHCYVVKLTVKTSHSQVAFKGHVIAFKQQPDNLLCQKTLPCASNQASKSIHVLFVSSRKLDDNTRALIPFRDIFTVSKHKIAMWLKFLKR